MASPAVSTPSSAGSPAALAPQPPLAIKTNMSSLTAISPNGSSRTPTIMTSKEWVIPPRPKPGRKPATDTPPTKRKAQNRAAQRAFRERRAARVGELEEQLEETKEEQQRREADMRDKILRLEADVQRFSGELQSWRLRCDTLDRIADYERKEKEAALAELAYLRKGASTTGTEAVALPPRRPRHQDSRQQQQPQTFQPQGQTSTTELPPGCGDCVSTGQCACADDAMAMATSGCGNCTAETHCQCLEDTIKNVDIPNSMDLKRSHSPANEHLEKRQRHSDPTTPLEIDFTAQFSSKSSEHNQNTYAAPIASRPPGESCGFCEEGTYCMCAEAAAAAANETQNKMRLAPLLNEITPPPSDTDVDGAVKLPSMHPNQMHRPVERPSTNPCANGPGTCQQCQQDPKSGLFCRSLAAMRASSSAGGTPDGCCGGNAGGGGCCKTKPSASSSQPPSLSCAETYQTLSTHKNFEQASDELSTWLGRLHATPPAQAGRPPMEVEAASVMGVLKLFDRRFGRG